MGNGADQVQPGGPGSTGAGATGLGSDAGSPPVKPKGGRPAGSKDTAPRKPRGAAVGEGAPAKSAPSPTPGTGSQINMEELAAEFKEELAVAEGITEALEFAPEEAEAILQLAVLEMSHWIMGRLERQEITEKEAERWAKCTRIVFWQYMKKMEAGIAVWSVLTLSLFLGKKSTKPPKPKEAASGGQG